MAQGPFKALKEAYYPLYAAAKPYSFDLNEHMIKLLREEFAADAIAARLAEATRGKKLSDAGEIGKEIFLEYGERWMSRTVALGEEYPDRTIEVVKETVDDNGQQFMFFPLVPQRFVEIAYLGTQRFLRLPMILNNQYELAYRVPGCLIFDQIREKCGADVAGLMTCQNACLQALKTLAKGLELKVEIAMTASTASDGHCDFSMKKL